ncbi:adenosylhomocysteinase [Nematocida displodere]|uniref:Adenosylhomocysteinase n=1 Tax=Nematocida displodere TaxID=1805483 RepID=A0A177EH75_9MICR|nr:adenosylhomocysteinase [Nematocida displodere]
MADTRETFPDYKIKNLELADLGEEALLFARNEMPGMQTLEKRHQASKPLKGARIAGSLHMTVQTAVMIEVLVSMGAEVAWCSSNILSTEDKAAAALVKKGLSIYAWKGETTEEYFWCLNAVLNKWPEGPNLIIDDGGDLTTLLHTTYPELIPKIKGQTEQTTTGTHILQGYLKKNTLKIPAICINESVMKSKFDNIYGCRESLIDGIKRATDAMIAGKRVHICGHGDVGKGCAQAMAKMGAIVTVSEIDPICAMQAVMEGYRVCRVDQVRKEVDIWVTATGNRDILTEEDFVEMKDLAILANIGHFDIEIDAAWIYANAVKVVSMGNNAERIVLPSGRSLVLLAEGRLSNLGCATGHSSFVMSTSFSCQVLAVLRLWQDFEASAAPRGAILFLSKQEDEDVARMHLEGLGHTITPLSESQVAYLGLPAAGPYKSNEYRY